MKRKSYPDDCECSARDRRTCQQACKPTRDAASVNAPQLATVDQVKGDKRWYVRVCGTDQARFESKGDAEIWADGWNAALGIAEPGVNATRGAIDKQIKVRQAAERVMHNGWYTHGCGQWVHDQFSPCSVCPRPRRPRKKK